MKNLSVSVPNTVLMNLPLLKENNANNAVAYLAIDASPWHKEYVAYSAPGETDFIQRAVISQRSSIFTILKNLESGPVGRWDWKNKIQLSTPAAELFSAEPLSVFSGGNALAVETADSGWEIVQFIKAELIDQNRYELSGLLRGQLGSDFEMNWGSLEDAKAVLVDSTLTKIEMSDAVFNTPYNWQIGAAIVPLGGSKMYQQSFAAQAINLRPLSPVHLKIKRQQNGELHLSWIRRSRINADNWEVAVTPIGEVGENYQITISDEDNAVKEVLDSKQPYLVITNENLETYGFNSVGEVHFSVVQYSETGYQSPASTVSIQLN